MVRRLVLDRYEPRPRGRAARAAREQRAAEQRRELRRAAPALAGSVAGTLIGSRIGGRVGGAVGFVAGAGLGELAARRMATARENAGTGAATAG